MNNCRWLIYWLYAGMALTLSGCCHSCGEDILPLPAEIAILSNGCHSYWIDRPVVLTRPLRIYPVYRLDALPEHVGSCLVNELNPKTSAIFSDGREYYEIPEGTEIVLREFCVQYGRDLLENYILFVDIVFPGNINSRVVYLMGREGVVAPFPWKSNIKPEEPFSPVDIEKLFPDGTWAMLDHSNCFSGNHQSMAMAFHP